MNDDTQHQANSAPARGEGSASHERVLERLKSAPRMTGEEAYEQSRLTRRLRIGLPVLALVLIGVFLVTSREQTDTSAFLQDFEDTAAGSQELRMANPRFTGIQDDGEQYEITAAQAVQTPDAKDVVKLDRPRAQQGDNAHTLVTAQRGVYQTEENVLTLQEDVTLTRMIGNEEYVFVTPNATVIVDEEFVTTDDGVGGEAKNGNALRADKMRAFNRDGRVVFEGNVRMRITPSENGKFSLKPASSKSTGNDQ